MPTSKKPRHKRRIKITGTQTLRTKPWKVASALDPLESFLNDLDSGEITVVTGGVYADTPAFKMVGKENWYDVVPAIRGLIAMMEIHESRSGHALPLEPLRRLIEKMKEDQPIFPSDTQDVRQSLEVLRRVSNEFNVDYADDLVKTVKTSIAMRR